MASLLERCRTMTKQIVVMLNLSGKLTAMICCCNLVTLLKNFNSENNCPYSFVHSAMIVSYPKVWTVFKMALILSHGHAAVEKRGFSVNKELVVENQQQQNLVARRISKDHIMYVNGVTNVAITRHMVSGARSVGSTYTAYLAQWKQEAKKKREKRKADDEVVHELGKKCKCLKTDVSALLSSAKDE